MKKILYAFFLITLLLNQTYGSTYKEELNKLKDGDLNEAIYVTYDQIGLAFELESINLEIYSNYKILSYGTPENASNGQYQIVDGKREYEYLGYTPTGEKITNALYPYDTNMQNKYLDDFNEFKWIDNPLDFDSIYKLDISLQFGAIKNNLDNKSNLHLREQYLENFLVGLELTHYDHLQTHYTPDPSKDFEVSDASINWAEYYHVILPPTDATFGVARLWNVAGSKLYYIDVLLVPNQMLTTEEAVESTEVVMDTQGIIQAMPRGSEEFNVIDGIPSGEELYIEVTTPEYIIELEVSRVTDLSVEDFSVPTYSEGDSIRPYEERIFGRPQYKYYKIKRLEVFIIDHAEVSNYALPDGNVSVEPNSAHYLPPSITVKRNGGCVLTATGLKSRNDTLIIDGQTILDGSRYGAFAPKPNPIVLPNCNEDALYHEGIVVDNQLLNKQNAESRTEVYYSLLEGINQSKSTEVIEIETNSITVHTPVGCDGSIINNLSYNQEITPDLTRASVILDRPTKIRLSAREQHLHFLGYGLRDYTEYVKEKQVKIPFDVYMKSTQKGEGDFLPANTWYSVPLDEDIIDIYVPSWVGEGNYSIDYRVIANNCEDVNLTEEKANLNIDNYVAIDAIDVRVIGQVYGFKITDIEDYPLWEEVFRVSEDSNLHTNTYYTVGNKDRDGNIIQSDPTFTLPIINGSHPIYKNKGALKTGYHFKYELETLGEYYHEKDCIEITPTFYYVDQEGKNRQEVSLWYHEYFDNEMHYFIQVGSEEDHFNKKYISIGDLDRNISEDILKQTSSIQGMNYEDFINKYSKIGWFDRQVLSKPLRTFIGDATNLPPSIDRDTVLQSVQHWYGEYYLPNDLFVASIDTDVAEYARIHGGLDGNEDFWLKNGYIIVNFNIETIKDGKFDDPILSYYDATYCNMWSMEGYTYEKKDDSNSTYVLEDGDILFYFTDEKSSDDYNSQGTH